MALITEAAKRAMQNWYNTIPHEQRTLPLMNIAGTTYTPAQLLNAVMRETQVGAVFVESMLGINLEMGP